MKPKSWTDPAFQRFFKDPASIIAPISIGVALTADDLCLTAAGVQDACVWGA